MRKIKVLLEYTHTPVSSGVYMTQDLLRREDVDVRTIGGSTGHVLSGKITQYMCTQNPPEHGWIPDIVIIMDIDKNIITRDRDYGEGCAVVVYGVDNHVADYWIGLEDAKIDHYFLAHDSCSLVNMKNRKITWLPCGYSPHWFNGPSVAFELRDYDCSMVGQMTPPRINMVYRLIRSGYKVNHGFGILFKEYVDSYIQSRVSLNSSFCSDVPMRMYESIAMGCMFVTDELLDIRRLKAKDLDFPAEWVHECKPSELVITVWDLISLKEKDLPKYPKEWMARQTWSSRFDTILRWYNAGHPSS